jgi:rod shape-determining protein MreD
VSYYVGLPLMLILAVAEATVLPMFRVGGLQPNLLLVCLVAWLVLRGASEAFVLIPVAGVCSGFVDGAPLGTALLALAPIAVLGDVRGSQLREGGLLVTIVFTVLMTLTYHLTYFLVFLLRGESGNLLTAVIDVVVPTAFLNVLILMPVYALISLASQEQRRAAYV